MDITGGISRFAGFLTTDIWRVRMENLHGAKKHLVRSLRIVLIAAEKFFEDRCTLFTTSELPDGTRWHESGEILTPYPDATATHAVVSHDLKFESDKIR